jgi:YNFM family putative membrane transporter
MFKQGTCVSRTTTIDIAPASDIDDLPAASQPVQFIKRGTPQFMRVTLALFSAGLATFALLYCVQPILPVLSHEFGVSPASSSVSLSISTGMLAIGLLFTGLFRRHWPQTGDGHRVDAGVRLYAAFHHDDQLARYSDDARADWVIAERRGGGRDDLPQRGDPPQLCRFSMGLYISGNSIGGMSGRLLSGVFTDFFNWRIALAVIGCFALASALMFWKILPESRHFRPTSLRPKTLFINFRLHWRDKGLPRLFLTGFLLMGSFVTLFNYIGYRLMLSPWHLSQAVVGLLSVAYLTGTWSSPKAGR